MSDDRVIQQIRDLEGEVTRLGQEVDRQALRIKRLEGGITVAKESLLNAKETLWFDSTTTLWEYLDWIQGGGA